MSNVKKLRSCTRCGGEYMGWNGSKYCPDCRRAMLYPQQPEPSDEDSWRHMFRDGTGTVIRPGGNVMHALDDLCAYEEACEAAGIRGPEALRKALTERQQASGDRQQVSGIRGRGTTPPPALRPVPLPLTGEVLRETRIATGKEGPRNDSGGGGEYDPTAKRARKARGLFCEKCAHYKPTVASGARGVCNRHPKRVRPEGGKGHGYVVLAEPRPVAARRAACRDYEDRQQATGVRHQGTGDDPSTGLEAGPPPLDRGGFAGDGRPEWVGPSAELKQQEGL